MRLTLAINSSRHKILLEHTLSILKESVLAPYIKDVLLYGSCARKEEKWDSDIDLFIEFVPDVFKDDSLYDEFRYLCNQVKPSNLASPDIDIHFTCSVNWRMSDNIYYKIIQKEGISVWN